MIVVSLTISFFVNAYQAEGETISLYPVRINNKWTYITITGQKATPKDWEYASPFRCGKYAIVAVEISGQKKYGIIDTELNYVCDPIYSFIEYDSFEGLYYGTEKTGIIWITSDDDKCGFMDIESGYFSGCIYDDYYPWVTDDPLLYLVKNGKGGYVDRNNGNVIIPFAYDPNYCTPFSNGWACVTKDSETNEWYLINHYEQTWIIPSGFELYSFTIDSQLALVKNTQTNLLGYCSSDGRIIIEAKFESAEPFENGVASVVLEGIPRIINTNGQTIFLGKKGEKLSVSKSRIFSNLNGRFILYDLNGTVLFERKDDFIVEPYENMDYLIIYRYVDSNCDNAYVGFIDLDGRIIIDPNQLYIMETQYIDNMSFSPYSPFCHELQMLKDKNNKYGYIDNSGNIVVDFIYDDARPFENGMARVKLNNDWYYIDSSGLQICKIESW